MESFQKIDDLHRRISNFETSHMDREIQQMEDVVRKISEREREITSELLAERAKVEQCNKQNKEIVHENQRVRKDLAAAKKMLADLKEEQLNNKLKAQEKASSEEVELNKKIGELNHRLQTRTQENAKLTTELKKSKEECDMYKKKCIQLENGKIPTYEFQVMGSLQTSLETQNTLTQQLTAELNGCRTKCAGLESALNSAMEELEQFRASSHNLTKELEEQGHNMDEVHKILNNEISLVKQQKAKLRCEFLKQKSDFVAIERELEAMKSADSEALKKCTELEKDLAIEKKLRRNAVQELEAAKTIEKELKEKLEKAEAESKGELTSLQSIIAKDKEQATKLKDFVKQQDKQCDELANQVQFLSDELDSYKEKYNKASKEASEIRHKLANTGVQEAELARLKEELGRAKDKNLFMDRQIKTLHVDYRGELADLTKKLALAQKDNFFSAPSTTTAPPPAKLKKEERRFSFVENQIQQLENELATERRLLKEKTQELENAKKSNSSKTYEEELKKKTIDAGNALSEAITKIHAKNEEIAQKESKINELTSEVNRILNQIADLEDELHMTKRKNANLEESMFYWKNLYERRNQPFSDNDALSNYTEELDKENVESVNPSLKDADCEDDRNSTLRYGMMRHEIAHGFKRVWMAVQKKSFECAKCREHLPSFQTAMKCQHCHLYAHISCARKMGKTCGLPADYAQLYVDAITDQRHFEEQQLSMPREHAVDM